MGYGWESNEDGTWALDLITNLGGIALSLIMIEAGIASDTEKFSEEGWLGPFGAAQPYARRRLGQGVIESLPELPVPDEFKQVFLDWAEGKVNFTGS